MLTPWAAQNTGARRDSRDTTSAKEAATNGTAVPSPRLRSAKGVDGKQRRTSEFRRQALHTRTFLAGPFSPSGGSNSLCRTTRCALPQSDDRAIAHMARAGFHLHCATVGPRQHQSEAPDSINQKPRVAEKRNFCSADCRGQKVFSRPVRASNLCIRRGRTGGNGDV
jgi:hypothetical protein